MAVFYNTTGGGTKSYSTVAGVISKAYATKIIIPSGNSINITSAVGSYGCTAYSGTFEIIPLSVTYSIYSHNAGTDRPNAHLYDLLSTTYSSTGSVTTHNSAVLDIDLSAGSYWVYVAMVGLSISGATATLELTENTGETTVNSDDGLSHAGRSGELPASFSDNLADLYFSISGTVVSGPPKPTTPTPSNGYTLDPVYDRYLTWQVGNLANYDTMDIYLGTVSGSLSKLETISPAVDYTVAEGSWPQDSIIYWRVDGTKDSLTTTGDEWYFDPRPIKATNPTPTDANTGISTYQSRVYFDKDGYKTQSHNIYFGPTGNLSLIDSGNINEYADLDDSLPLAHGTEYSWRVDSVSTNGTTTGDTWSFTTGSFDAIYPSFRLLAGGAGYGPNHDPPGVEGTDFEWTGYNFIATVRRAVAAAKDAIWFEA